MVRAEPHRLGDINQDGYNDIGSGPYWHEGADLKKHHESWAPQDVKFLRETIDPEDGRPPNQLRHSDSLLAFVYDFNGAFLHESERDLKSAEGARTTRTPVACCSIAPTR